MQMNVSITEKMYEMVQEKVKSGLYSNASEVVRDALRRMEEHQQRQQNWQDLREALNMAETSGRSNKTLDDLTAEILNEG